MKKIEIISGTPDEVQKKTNAFLVKITGTINSPITITSSTCYVTTNVGSYIQLTVVIGYSEESLHT